jgi:hypothetical protein
MAEGIQRVAQNVNQSNHIRPADGGPFYLAVQLSQIPNHPKAMMDGANGIDITGKFSKGASRPFRREPP